MAAHLDVTRDSRFVSRTLSMAGWVGSARRRWCPLILVLLAATVMACQGSPPATPAATEVRVLASWEGPEIDAFRAAVAPFEERTGYRIVVSTTRDLKGALERAIASGDPPDIAGLPGPGYMLELVRNRQLVDLSEVIDVGTYKNETAPGLVEVGTVDDMLAGVFIKGTVKGLLSVQPRRLPSDQHRDLDRASAPGDDREQGQPGPTLVRRAFVGRLIGVARDRLVEDFVLRQSGPELYDDWVAGRLAWDSPDIRSAFRAYSTVVADADVAGGVEGALRTHFTDAGNGLFTDPPQCLFVHQGTFMATFLDEAVEQQGGRYDWLPFPDIDPRFAGALMRRREILLL